MSFSADISKFVKKARGNMDEAVQGVALELAARLVARTPVESGVARGNWQAGIGGFRAEPTGEPDKSGETTLANIAATIGGARAGQTIYLTNTLSYIGRLEHGASKQAPAGMVTVTLTEFPGVVRQAASAVSS